MRTKNSPSSNSTDKSMGYLEIRPTQYRDEVEQESNKYQNPKSTLNPGLPINNSKVVSKNKNKNPRRRHRVGPSRSSRSIRYVPDVARLLACFLLDLSWHLRLRGHSRWQVLLRECCERDSSSATPHRRLSMCHSRRDGSDRYTITIAWEGDICWRRQRRRIRRCRYSLNRRRRDRCQLELTSHGAQTRRLGCRKAGAGGVDLKSAGAGDFRGEIHDWRLGFCCYCGWFLRRCRCRRSLGGTTDLARLSGLLCSRCRLC